MAHNTKLTDLVANTQANAQAALADNGYLRWYDGAQPATADTPITDQNMVAELRFGLTAFGPAAAGVITANAIAPDPAAIGGIAAWFRIFAADGTTPLWDGNIGLVGSNSDIELNSVIVPPGIECGLTEFTHTVVK